MQRACSLPCALSDFPFLLGTKVQPCLQVTSKVTPPSLSRQPLSRTGHKKPHCWDSGPPPPPVLSQAYERLWCACMSIRMFTLQCAGANAHRSEADIEGVFLNCSFICSLRQVFFFSIKPRAFGYGSLTSQLTPGSSHLPLSRLGDYTTKGLNADPHSCTQMLYPLSHLPASPKELTYS